MAGLIPQSFIHDLLARTDIVQVIGERLSLKKAGKEYVALSPFTNEKSPSFTVSPQKQFYHCFSSGRHGTAITFLMEYDRLSFVEAVEELARRAGVQVPREGGTAVARPVLDGPLDALALAERVFKAELRKHPRAIEYLKARGVTGETAKAFGIGFAPDAWDTLARQFPEPKHALDAGLLVRNDQGRLYDFYRNRIMFPVRNTRGQVITFGGRVMPGSDDPRKYLNGRETPLFNKSQHLYGLHEALQARDLPYVLVVEGYMDCVMLHQHGLTNTVATLGTATTREHLALLFNRAKVPRIVFCFDGDRAGRAAAWRALDQALPELTETRECAFMFLPEGQDPDTLVRQVGADAFRQQAVQAQPVLQYLFAELRKRANTATAEGRAKLAALARPYLAALRAGALRDKILDELALLTRWNRADVEAALRAPESAAAGAAPAAAAADFSLSRPVRRALRILLERPQLQEAVDDIGLVTQSHATGVQVLAEVLRFFRDQPGATTAQLLEAWRGSPEGELINQLSIAPLDLAETGFEQEFLAKIKTLENAAVTLGLAVRMREILEAADGRTLTPQEQAELAEINRSLAAAKVSKAGDFA